MSLAANPSGAHEIAHHVFSCVHVAQSLLVFLCVVFCRSLFILLSFFCWLFLYFFCMFFFDLRLLIIPFVYLQKSVLIIFNAITKSGLKILTEKLYCAYFLLNQLNEFLLVYVDGWFDWSMVFNATFNNISVISWRSVLRLEETGVLGENYRSVASHWQTLSHNVVSSTSPWTGFELITLVVIGIDCIDSFKSNYHTITTTEALVNVAILLSLQNYKHNN